MEKKDYYIYPAVFSYGDDGISVRFPDLPGCFTCANNDREALVMAKEAMALHISGLEEGGQELPQPSPIASLKLEKNETTVLIEVWMPVYIDKIKVVSVKKTLTLPKWLNDAAEQHQINFSKVLQEALKEHLGFKS